MDNAKSEQQLLDELRKELAKENYDTSHLSDEELKKELKKVGIEVINVKDN